MKPEEIDKIYKKLRKKYTDEEIAKSYIFPGDPLTDDERKELSKTIKNRKRTLSKEELDILNKFLKNGDIC